MVEAQLRVLLDASMAQGPLEDVNLMEPGEAPATGRKVAQVCWDHVPLERMQPMFEPSEVKTWIVPLSSVDVCECLGWCGEYNWTGG